MLEMDGVKDGRKETEGDMDGLGEGTPVGIMDGTTLGT
jgi:hypothetical protein